MNKNSVKKMLKIDFIGCKIPKTVPQAATIDRNM
jgi:hypothetical protein